MRNIDRFILHIVHNWTNKLDEAYSEKAIQTFINKFKEEAEDFNIQITDDQLKAYITTFDRIKEKLPSDQRDLNKWTLSKFIKLVTATEGGEAAEEVDITPDVVYHNDDNTIVIYNGSKEGNCILYGKGEKWCITRGSFADYRYNERRGNPTFYLAKNNNLSDRDKLSFVAIQVRDTNSPWMNSKKYVYTNRSNSPYESNSMDFEELIEEVPWLEEIPNLRSILKYIPLSSSEKLARQYKSVAASYREWVKFPFSVKKQYLVVRKDYRDLFSDINNNEFFEKHLSKYPELAFFISITPGIIDPILLLKNLDKFSNQNRRSIITNLRGKIKTSYLPSDTFSFDIKKLLVQLNKWDVGYNERLYVTKDKDTIVKLELGDDIKINLYQEEDDFPNIKLNKRTLKYLLDYPELDKIPLENILKLIEDNIVDKDLIIKILDNARKNPNSALIISQTDDGEIILDSNSFSSYKVDKNNSIVPVPLDSEEVQQAFNSAKDNEVFQQNALNLFIPGAIPKFVNKNALISVINAIPYNQRIITTPPETNQSVLVLTAAAGNIPFFMVPSVLTDVRDVLEYTYTYGDFDNREWFDRYSTSAITDETMQSYFAYLRQINKSYNDEELLTILRTEGARDRKKIFARNNPPVNETNIYKLAVVNDAVYLVNTENPRESFQLSDKSGKLLKASIPPSTVRQLLGTNAQAAAPAAQQDAGETPAAPADQIRRRGRPPGGGQPRAAAPAAPAEPGNLRLSTITNQYNLTAAFNNLPRNILRRFNVDGRRVPVPNNRGASRRQNILGNNGQVIAAYEFGTNDIYIIRLANNTSVASLVSQPGNHHYLITPQNAFSLDSPANLLQALQQRNLAEVHRYIMNEYFERNPHHLNEFKQLLRKHINEKKNETK